MFYLNNDEYLYVGFISNNKPHGPGQLYKINKVNSNHNIATKFIEAEFIDGFIESLDCLIIL